MCRNHGIAESSISKRFVLAMVLVFTLAISGSVAVTSSETDADSIDYVYEINNIEFNGILYGEEHPTGIPGSIDLTDLEKYFTVKVSRTPVNSDGTLGVKEADVTLTADGFYLSVGGGLLIPIQNPSQ